MRPGVVVGVAGFLLACTLVAPLSAQLLEEVFVAAPDGILLATDVYYPIGHGWGPWPVILQRTPYGKGPTGMAADTCKAWASLGFLCVAQDVRGTGRSGGSNTVFRDDKGDGQASIAWILQRGLSDGHIGTFGGSALGITEYSLAPGAPPELICQLPAVATADFYHHAAYQGGALRYGLVFPWLDGQNALSFYEQIKQHRSYDPWWDAVAIPPHVGEVRAAGYHLGGWYDIFLQGTLDAFHAQQHHGGPGAFGTQHLRVGPWTHKGLGQSSAGELTYPANALTADALVASFRDWFMYWLMGQKPGVARWPAVQIYLMGASGEPGAPGNVWLDLPDWPPPAVTVPLFLQPQGRLLESAVTTGSLVLPMDPTDPVPTLGGANLFDSVAGVAQGIGPTDQRPIESRTDVAVFTTPVLAAPVTVVGRVSCTIWIDPDTTDLDLAVRLTDVYPDGRSMLLSDGIQRARMRCGDDHSCLLVPHVPTEIAVDLWSTAISFAPGHRIRIDVAGSNFPRFEVNPNTGGDFATPTPGVTARPLVLLGPDHPSRLELSVYLPAHRPRRHLGRD